MKCVTFVSDTFTRYGSKITNVWQEILTPVTLAFCCEVVHENYKNPSVFVKVTAKKNQWHLFMWTHVYRNAVPVQKKYLRERNVVPTRSRTTTPLMASTSERNMICPLSGRCQGDATH